MTSLQAFSLASFLFVLAFTLVAYNAAPGKGQSPRSAVVEAWSNILVGFTVNYFANLLILPLIGITPTAAENFLVGWIYTAVSIARQYAIRRWFNARLHDFAVLVGGQGR